MAQRLALRASWLDSIAFGLALPTGIAGTLSAMPGFLGCPIRSGNRNFTCLEIRHGRLDVCPIERELKE